jgi:hypothetical protein
MRGWGPVERQLVAKGLSQQWYHDPALSIARPIEKSEWPHCSGVWVVIVSCPAKWNGSPTFFKMLDCTTW